MTPEELNVVQALGLNVHVGPHRLKSRPMSLSDEDIALLDECSVGEPRDFEVFLDDVIEMSTEAIQAHKFYRYGNFPIGTLPYLADEPLVSLCSRFPGYACQNTERAKFVDDVLDYITASGVMGRVVGCLHLLRLAGYAEYTEFACPHIVAVQAQLSSLLVSHPVLMNPRLVVANDFTGSSQFGCIAAVIAATPMASLPRLAHGVDLQALRVFAQHPSVNGGLRQEGHLGNMHARYSLFSGRNALDMWVREFGYNLRSYAYALSVLELDGHRAFGLPPSRRPASFMKARSAEKNMQAQRCVRSAFLVAIRLTKTDPLPEDGLAFVQALKSAPSNYLPQFLATIELTLDQWVGAPPERVSAGFVALGQAIRELEPDGLSTGICDTPLHPSPLIAWLLSAVLDSSFQRGQDLGIGPKKFPTVGIASAQAFFDAVDLLDATEPAHHRGKWPAFAEAILERSYIQSESRGAWRAALTYHVMQKRLRQLIPLSPGPHGDPEPGGDDAPRSPPPTRRNRLE